MSDFTDTISEALLCEGITATDEQIARIAESCSVHESESASLRSNSYGNPAAYEESQKLRQTKEHYDGEAKRMQAQYDERVADLERTIRYLRHDLQEATRDRLKP